MERLFRRTYWFLRAYARFLGIHVVLQSSGFDGARKRYLKSWKKASKGQFQRTEMLDDIDWAVQKAKAWQWKKTECLPTSLCAFSLLREANKQPHFVIAVQSQPYAAHAWTHIMGRVIADQAMGDVRKYYTTIIQVPNEINNKTSTKFIRTNISVANTDKWTQQKVIAG